MGNTAYANEDSGINILPGGNNAVVAGNLTYGNGDHGIDNRDASGGAITGNTVVGNCTSGINVEGTSSGYAIENNVAVNNATGAIFYPTPHTGTWINDCNLRGPGNIRVADNAASATGATTADYNLVWQTGAGDEYRWGGIAYASQAALFAATGQEAHGLFADPTFVNLAGNNFSLAAGSPAIDSADSAATGEQTTDLLGHPRVDDPATPNTGVGPRDYDDRGAYEYQPVDHAPAITSGGSASFTGGVGWVVHRDDDGCANAVVVQDRCVAVRGDVRRQR